MKQRNYQHMMFQTVGLWCLISLLWGCAKPPEESTATITIPPFQEFILGAYEPGAFAASLRNLSDLSIEIRTMDSLNEQTSGFGFSPKGETELNVGAGERVIFSNSNDQLVRLAVGLTQKVQGMQYEVLDLEDLNVQGRLAAAELRPLVGAPWLGTVQVYSDRERIGDTLNCELTVTLLNEDTYRFQFIFPDHPIQDTTAEFRIKRDGRQFGAASVLSVVREGSVRSLRTMENWEVVDRDALLFRTYRIEDHTLSITTAYQTAGSEELKQYRLYSFKR